MRSQNLTSQNLTSQNLTSQNLTSQNLTSKEGRFTPAVAPRELSGTSGGKPPFLTC
jgi:hypothetical protein